ncbi:MAG: hypothetical protein ABI461_21480 [Polyangiaceae bacterium]
MKELAITVFAGPLLMALLCGLGVPCGYYLGFIASCVIVAVVAIGLGVLLARVTDGLVAPLAALAAIATGVASAYGFNTVHELQSGAFARNVPLADLATLQDKDRLSLRDGVALEGLFEIASETSRSGGVGSRSHQLTSFCEAYPIVPEGWTSGDAVQVWRFGEDDKIQGEPIAERVFHPGQPSDLCRKAINTVIAKHQITVVAHPIYLEARVSDSANADANRYEGAFAVALLGSLWIVVALFQGLRASCVSDRRPR